MNEPTTIPCCPPPPPTEPLELEPDHRWSDDDATIELVAPEWFGR